jgi:hypothetical protein
MSDELREYNNSRREREEATKDSDGDLPRKKRFKRTFDEYIQALVAYKRKHGQYTSLSSNDDSMYLYRWVLKVRRGEIDLTDDQREIFDGMGLVFGERSIRSWNENFEELKAYKEQHGNCAVPSKFKADPPLGHWVGRQRTLLKNETLSVDHKMLLESIGFAWQLLVKKPCDATESDERWMQQYNKLVEFNDETRGDRLMVPTLVLAKWVTSQWKLHTENTLQQDRRDLVDKLGFVWSEFDWSVPHASAPAGGGAAAAAAAAVSKPTHFDEFVHTAEPTEPNADERLTMWTSETPPAPVEFAQPDRLGFVCSEFDWSVPHMAAAAAAADALSQPTHHADESIPAAAPNGPTNADEQVPIWMNEHPPALVEFAPPAAAFRANEQVSAVCNSVSRPPPSESALAAWDGMMARLLHFKHENGHPNVPPNFTSEWGRLGEWLETQRGIGGNGGLHCWQAMQLLEVGITSWRIEED